jgi:hypothetical protein
MSSDYTHIIDLAKAVVPPEDGILTRTLLNNDAVKAVIRPRNVKERCN